MHHTVAYTDSVAAVTNDDIPAINDDIIPIVNSHFQFQQNRDLLYAFAAGLGLDRARIVSPKHRQVTLPFIRPHNVGVLPVNDPNVADFRANPFRLAGLEEIAIEASTTGVGPNRIHVLLGVATSRTPASAGDIYTIRGTSTTAAVVNTWTTITTTWADLLGAGDYDVVGLEVFSTNAIAARLIFDDQMERPGGVSIGALGNRTHAMFYKGGLGRWGTFRSTNMPRVQVLANVADASHEVFMDIIRR